MGLALQEMNDMHEVGENKPEPFDKEKPTIYLLFEDAKSIDVVLKTLLDAKKNLQDVHDK